MLGLERGLGTRIVTYADDLVILCRHVMCPVIGLSVGPAILPGQFAPNPRASRGSGQGLDRGSGSGLAEGR